MLTGYLHRGAPLGRCTRRMVSLGRRSSPPEPPDPPPGLAGTTLLSDEDPSAAAVSVGTTCSLLSDWLSAGGVSPGNLDFTSSDAAVVAVSVDATGWELEVGCDVDTTTGWLVAEGVTTGWLLADDVVIVVPAVLVVGVLPIILPNTCNDVM